MRKGITAFKTPQGHFKYLIMPFCLTNTLAIFQFLINYVLQFSAIHFVFVYLDDIMIFFTEPSRAPSPCLAGTAEIAGEQTVCESREM